MNTPRTDAALETVKKSPTWDALIECSRELERELLIERAMLDVRLSNMRSDLALATGERDALRIGMDAATRNADRARKVLSDFVNYVSPGDDVPLAAMLADARALVTP